MAFGIYAYRYAHTGQAINAWVRTFDAEAHEGQGEAKFTPDAALALPFDSTPEAIAFWRTQSTTRPLRADGEANRPLTAFTVEIRALPGHDGGGVVDRPLPGYHTPWSTPTAST
jgi:hypothetical protein